MLNYWSGQIRNDLDSWRLTGPPGRVVVFLTVETNCPAADCGWDEFAQSAKRLDCPTCGGKGKVTTLTEYSLRARVVWSNTGLLYVSPTPGVAVGDVTLGIMREDLALIESVMASQRSYITVDGMNVRPTHAAPSVIPAVEEAYLVTCSIYHVPEF